MLKSDGARFSKKILVRLFWGKKGVKMGFLSFFVIFLKNGSNDFVHIVHIDGWDDSPSFCKKPHVKENSGSRDMGQNVSPIPHPPCHYGRNRSPKYEMVKYEEMHQMEK